MIALVAAEARACETSIAIPAATQTPATASLTQLMQSQEPESANAAVEAEAESNPDNIDPAPSIEKPDHCESAIDARKDNECTCTSAHSGSAC